MEFKKNISLKHYTTFQIGGRAEYFFTAKTKLSLVKAIRRAKKMRLPFFILAGGSNILFSDKKFDGVIIKIQNTKYKIQNTKIYAEAGVLLGQLVNRAVKSELTGLEWAAGITGTIGGASQGNAGSFEKSMKDIVNEVEVFDVKNNKIKIFKNKDCQFSYRQSIFKKNKNLIILSAILKLKKGKKKEIQNKIKEYLDYKKKTQPLNFPSAGSIFKNPPGFFAAELIEKCNLKGKQIGGAKISEKHANFIVNLGGAESEDVIKLINLIKNKVKKKFGVVLKEEIQIL